MSAQASESRIIASRYVRALFDLASEQKSADLVDKDLNALKSALNDSPDFEKQLSSPIVEKNALAKAVDEVLAKLKATELTRKFFRVLAANQRLSVVHEVIEQYGLELAKSRGELLAEVTSAYPLSKEEKTTIEQSLKKSTGKKVNVAYHESPEILGGLIVKVGGKMIDNSVLGKIEKLQLQMKSGATK